MSTSFRPTGLPAEAPFHFWEVAGLSWGRIPRAALDVLFSHYLTRCQACIDRTDLKLLKKLGGVELGLEGEFVVEDQLLPGFG